jgi:hypothetical protein
MTDLAGDHDGVVSDYARAAPSIKLEYAMSCKSERLFMALSDLASLPIDA